MPKGVREVHLHIPLRDEDLRELRAGDIVYLSGVAFTARDGVYGYMLGQGHPPPIDLRQHNVSFQSSPGARRLENGSWEVASLQATAGFRYAKWMPQLLDLGIKAVVGKGGMPPEVYREVFAPRGAVFLTTVGYGIGAIYARGVKRVVHVFWEEELGISEAMWVMEVERMGPLIVEGDTLGHSYFSTQVDPVVDQTLMAPYEGLKPYILRRLGETHSPLDDVTSTE